MSFASMIGELQANVTGTDAAYAATLINEAWGDVRRLGGWSWQLQETGFTVPGALSTGTVTLTFGSPYVVGDSDAVAAWTTVGIGSQYGSLLTQRQFRSGGTSGAGTMYDIIAFDGVSTLTLNRPFSDPLTSLSAAVPTQEYFIYQPYIVAPVKDFRRWLTVYDIANCGSLNVRGDRKAIPGPGGDPQRQIFTNPGSLLALGQDSRGQGTATPSSTLGWERYELWPGPQNQFLYQAWFVRHGADLVNLTDELPIGIPESMVKAQARYRCYEQAEANKDPQNPRGSGADYRFLMGAALKQYETSLKQARLQDRDKCDIFFTTMHRFRGGISPTTFNPATGGVLSQVGI
jgi:hypothetical protein